MDNSKIKELISIRQNLLQQERTLGIATIEHLNAQYKQLNGPNFGNQLAKNCLLDMGDEICRRYFMKDKYNFYLSPTQFVDHVLHFSYTNKQNNDDHELLNMFQLYHAETNKETLRDINAACKNAQTQLFTIPRKKDQLDQAGKKAYRESKRTADGQLYDELTNKESGYNTVVLKNGNSYTKSDLQADHILARESISFDNRYTKDSKLNDLRQFYNSDPNFILIHQSANSSKGDVRVCEIDGKVEYLTTKDGNYSIAHDITYRATPAQMTEATIHQWEKETKTGNKIEQLKAVGYLNQDGKVPDDIRKKVYQSYQSTMQAESIQVLQTTNYKNVSADALGKTQQSFSKIIAGQVIYYVLPPVLYEAKTIAAKKGMTIDDFCKDLKRAGKRVISYVKSKLKEILNNVLASSFTTFIKNFFDILINLVKTTVKRLLKVVKNVALSLVQCGKTLMDKQTTSAQKADAITKILSATVTTIVLEALFEYLEAQFGIPDIIMEPLQIIVTIIATNAIMLVLQKVDLFNVQYGFMVANIEAIYKENMSLYTAQSAALYNEHQNQMSTLISDIKLEIDQTRQFLEDVSPYDSSIIEKLEEINALFVMGIDFESQWGIYAGIQQGG